MGVALSDVLDAASLDVTIDCQQPSHQIDPNLLELLIRELHFVQRGVLVRVVRIEGLVAPSSA